MSSVLSHGICDASTTKHMICLNIRMSTTCSVRLIPAFMCWSPHGAGMKRLEISCTRLRVTNTGLTQRLRISMLCEDVDKFWSSQGGIELVTCFREPSHEQQYGDTLETKQPRQVTQYTTCTPSRTVWQICHGCKEKQELRQQQAHDAPPPRARER
jgi:hypothetical protein